MFDKFVADLLTTYLGEYCDNIDREQVKVSVWNGRVHLRDLKVRRDALRFFNVPLCIIMGTIEELTVVIPWTHLRSEPVVVEIRGARLILADKETAQYDVDQEKREERLRKDRELVGADETLLLAFKEALSKQSKASSAAVPPPEASADTNDNNFTARLKASILNNIRVEVKELFVHYTSSVAAAASAHEEAEDGLLPNASSSASTAAAGATAASPTKQAFLSFEIREMKTCGCNERFEPAFVDLGARMSRQLISFAGMAVSLKTSHNTEGAVPLLRPLNVAVELAYQPVVIDPTTPQYMVAVHMDDPCASVLTSDSCTTCYDLLRQLRHVRDRQALRRFRPIGDRPIAAPQQWWRYVLDAVRQQRRQDRSASLASAHKPTPFSWLTYTATKAKRDRYVVLYMRRQRVQLGAVRWLEALTVDEHVEMVRLEEELSIEMLKLAKRLAMERVMVERTEYDKLLRQKRAAALAAGAAASPTATKTALPSAETTTTQEAAGSKGGWFSFWRSASPVSGGGGAAGPAGVADDGVDDATRAELRELVQLMTAERWTDTQRAVIAREFGVSAEEAKAMAQPGGSPQTSGAASAISGAPAKTATAGGQRLRAAPAWVVFFRTASVSLELQSSESEAMALRQPSASGTASSSSSSREILAKLLLGQLQGGGEWGGGSGGAVDAALPLAYYWGSVDHFAVTAANLSDSQQQQQSGVRREQEILTIGQLRTARDADPRRAATAAAKASSPLAANRAVVNAAGRRARPFSPLEACWSILSDECRRNAAWQFQWFQRSPQQLVSRASAVHRVKCRVAPMRLVVDIVPLRRLTDFFFSVMWPTAATIAGSSGSGGGGGGGGADGNSSVSPSSPAATEAGSFVTALGMPAAAPLTHVEQRCAADAAARRIVLRRKVARQHSTEWDVLMDGVTVSLAEIPDVQGGELVVRTLTIRNDIVHRLQRQSRLQSSDSSSGAAGEEGKAPAAVLGSAETDWLDYTYVEVESASLAVFLPTSPSGVPGVKSGAAPAVPIIARVAILDEKHFAVVVERSLLGRCLPDRPPYKLAVSSRGAVELAWSRAALSVLATALSTLADLAVTVGETFVQRGGGAAAALTENRDATAAAESTATFRVRVLPHLTHRAHWKTAEPSTESCSAAEVVRGDVSSTDVFYKQMHPFSASRLAATTGEAAAASSRRRVDVRRGACVVYHPERLAFPAEYYTLQRGCTRVRRTGVTGSGSEAPQPYVHLYVLQGGADQSVVLTAAYDAAEQLLLEVVGVPPALLRNAVWLERAVRAWIEGQGSSTGLPEASPEQVQRILQALELVQLGCHLVPCRYVAFQCASEAEACQLEATLLRCCVASSQPPLLLSPTVQTQYNAAVVPAALRKQPHWTIEMNLPSLRMVCAGEEPTPCCDTLPSTAAKTEAKTTANGVRSDAVLSFVPFGLRYDRFAEKQRIELTVREKMEMRACRGEVALPLLAIHQRREQSPTASQDSPASDPTLFLRFVGYFRPQPLPSLKRCAIYVGDTAAVKLRVGPAMLEWTEAWWDSVGLLTNKLFAEEVIVGYPWWTPSQAEPFRASREAGAAWCSAPDYGGNATSTLVELTASALAVEVALPPAPASVQQQESTCVFGESAVLRFDTGATRLCCHLTEAMNSVQVELKCPRLQWQPPCSGAGGGAERRNGWLMVVDDASLTPDSLAELAAEWKLHKSPPMVSTSDWLCGREGDAAHQSTGLRARQELEMRLASVRLLYWHPLLLHMMHAVQEGVLRRAVTIANREACWCHGGVLYCPPLSWPHRGVPHTAEVSWDGMQKSVSLQRVVLEMPEDLTWMQRRSTASVASGPLTPACQITVDRLTYSDCMCVRAGIAESPADAVDVAHTIEFHGMILRRHTASSALSAAFAVTMPHWTVTLTIPVFQAASLWREDDAWHKAFRVCFHGDTQGTNAGAATSSTVSSDDLAFVMELLRANFVVGDGVTGVEAGEHTEESPASLLKRVAETSTWQLDVEARLRVQLQRAEEHTFLNSVVEIDAARAVLERGPGNELGCSLEAQHLLIGTAHGARGTRTDSVAVVPLLSFPTSASSATNSPPLLHMQYGWRCLTADAAEGGITGSISSSGSNSFPTTAGRALYASLTTTHGLCVAADDVGWGRLRSFAESDALQQSIRRFSPPAESSTAVPSSPPLPPVTGWERIAVKLQLAQMECRLPCAPAPGGGGGAGSTPTSSHLHLSLLCSHALLRLRKDRESWRGMVNVGRLVRCVLIDERDATLAPCAVPLLLEQPSGWSQPTSSSPRQSRRSGATPSPTRGVQQTMEAPKPAQQNLLDELFGELPSPTSSPTAAVIPTRAEKHAAAPPAMVVTSPLSPGEARTAACLAVEFTYTPSRFTFVTTLSPLWALTPSMAHMSQMLAGIRQQIHRVTASLEASGSTKASHTLVVPPFVSPTFAVDVRLGPVSVFVLQREAMVTPADCTAQQAEDAVKHALDAEALLVATEGVTVQWDSETAATPRTTTTGSGLTVLQLRNTSICALRGLQDCTVLLERFGVAVTRQHVGGGGEEWKLSLDPLQLTLTQFHYAALLRVALQQTSFIAALTSSATTASQTPAAVAVVKEGGIALASGPAAAPQPTTGASTRVRLHIAALRLRVEENDDGDAAQAGSVRAVYIQLRDLDATYFTGSAGDGGSTTALPDGWEDVEGAKGSRGQPLRFTGSLHSCLVGTEGAIPTFSLAAPHASSSSTSDTPSFLFRATQDAAVAGAKHGFVHVKQVTVTVEAIPMMAWLDLLYAPYLQIAVPDYHTAKEQVMQQDLWLSEDLVLTEQTPLRVVNKSYSLLYLYGNGYTIVLGAAAARRGRLILLEEGVTLRVMHAMVCMEGESIEGYVSAGNGSYVVIDRETCTIVRPSDPAHDLLSSLPSSDETKSAARASQRQAENTTAWTEFKGDIQLQLRIPEPRSAVSSASPASSTLRTDPASASRGGAAAARGGAQRTLVLYSDMRLSLVNVASAVPHVNDVSGSFVLAHAGVRSEFVAADGTTLSASHLVSDWAMTVQYTEEAGHTDSGAGVQHLRNVQLDASSGVEMRVQYSDVFFVLRAARHAQSAFARWKDVLRGDLWSSLSVLPQNWDATGEDGQISGVALTREERAATVSSAETKTSVAVQIPFISFVAVDDSQSVDTPLFCLYVKEVGIPSCAIEAPHTKMEVRFTVQLEYYGLAKSQWAPVLDPLTVSIAFNWRQNCSLLDLYSRQGFVRLAVQTGVVQGYFTLELLRNLRQLQLLRATVEAAGVELFKSTDPTSTATAGAASSGHLSYHAFSLLQTTGVRLAARMPTYTPFTANDGGRSASAPLTSSHIVASGEAWPFNLPRVQGRDLPRRQQKILVQLQTSASCLDESRGGVVAVASVGVQRVPLHLSGPLQRYVIAEVSVKSQQQQQQGLKQVHLHSTVLFRNHLSLDLVQLAANERGTYDAVGSVPGGAERYVSVEVLRRRMCLALARPSSSAQQPAKTLALRPDSVVVLGMSYDALPCLVNNVLLCTADAAESADGQHAASPTPLAKGKLFDIHRGASVKSFFRLRVEAASSQPPDVTRYAALAPLRSVTVVAEAAVTIHNAVGLPLSLTLLTRRVRPGVRMGLLDTSPDTAIYTTVATTTLSPNGSYGAVEMDPLDDVCVSVALQQPNGETLLQWSSQAVPSSSGGVEGGTATAYYAPACVYSATERGRRDGQLVLADPATGATLVLYIKYTQRVVTLYCPHWVVNETQLAVQLADTSNPHAGDADRCGNPIAGLSGRTVRTATIAAWEAAQQDRTTGEGGGAPDTAAGTSVSAHIHLYNSLWAESCARNKSNAGANGLFVRVWEPATPGSSESPGFSDWSQQPLAVHEVSEVQVVTCASRRTRGAVVVLSCRVELGSQTSLHAYSDTRVVYIRPRWVVVNKSPYTLSFSQLISATVRQATGSGDMPWMRVQPFEEKVVPPVVVTSPGPGGRLHPLLSFCVRDDAEHNVQQCRWSSSLPINVVHEESTNLVYHTLIPLTQYWPQGSKGTEHSHGGKSAPCVPDSLPPLKPEDIKEIRGELFVDREETKVFSTTAYAYKGCMMCVEVAEATLPPIVVENRTSYTICFQQCGVRRAATVFPRCRKAWTWDAPPTGLGTPAVIELWLARAQETPNGATTTSGRSSAAATPCVLNFDPQLIGRQSRDGNGFQQEIEVEDPVRGTSTMLFVRVRGVHGVSYAVSITTEPTIDAYRTLPFPQISFALQVESVLALLCGEDAQRVLLCSVTPLSLTFAQGIRRRREDTASRSTDTESGDTDVQCLQLRLKSFQVDDARPAAKERVVAQLVDDKESGFQIERKLLRTTPILCCSTVAFRLTPVELHVEDGFITAMMDYQELVSGAWGLAWAAAMTPATSSARRLAASHAQPPWQADLSTALSQAWQAYNDEASGSGSSDGGGGGRVGLASKGVITHRPAAPFSSRVVSMDQFYIDPVLVSLSLYRSPGAADDPLWKLAGAASLLVGSTQDARLQWDAVQRRNVSDTIWHLLFLHRDAYQEQMRKQYMSLVNVMGIDTMRNFVSDLLSVVSDDPRDRGGGAGGRSAVRRQKPRVPLRFSSNSSTSSQSDTAARHRNRAAASPSSDATEEEEAAFMNSSVVLWVQQVRDRPLPVSAQRTVPVSEVARGYPWSDFIAVAQAAEIRAYGGLALARTIAEMPTTPRLSQRGAEAGGGGGGARRPNAAGSVISGPGGTRVHCARCVELEALRLRRLREGAATPLPHPVRDGFVTWDEFAHHINWYEFLDMCSDEEVCAYASLVRSGSAEASQNVCLLTLN